MIIKKHNKLFNENYRINYSSVEHKNRLSDINNLIVKECLKNAITPPFITISSDIPSNSGLGSSSSINWFVKICCERRKISKHKLAEEACKVEIDMIKIILVNKINMQLVLVD